MATAQPPSDGDTAIRRRQISPLVAAVLVLLVGGMSYGIYAAVRVLGQRRAERPAALQTNPSVPAATPTSAAAPSQPAQQQEEPAYFVPGEIIVKLRGDSAAPMSTFVDLGLERKNQLMPPGEILLRVRGFTTLDAQTMAARMENALSRLRVLPQIERAERNYIFKPQGGFLPGRIPNDPMYAEQWQFRENGTATGQVPGAINLEQQWTKTTGSRDIVVGLLDTGILPQHPQVIGSGNRLPGFDIIGDTATSNDGDGPDPDPTDPGNECRNPRRAADWHGSQMAGIVGIGRTDQGLGIAGVNWNVRVQPVRVLGRCGGAETDVAVGLRWTVGLPQPGLPPNPTPARVVNMSFAVPLPCSGTSTLRDAIAAALAHGAIIVVAAGNEAHDARNYSPASCARVIPVAASDRRGMLARYSNWGSSIAIMAPGGDTARDDDGNGRRDGIISFSHASANNYAIGNGTSQATAHVSGVVALWLSQNPTWTLAEVQAALKANAIKTKCAKPCGAGLLNALR